VVAVERVVAQPADDFRVRAAVPERGDATDFEGATRPLDLLGRGGLADEVGVKVVVPERGEQVGGLVLARQSPFV